MSGSDRSGTFILEVFVVRMFASLRFLSPADAKACSHGIDVFADTLRYGASARLASMWNAS